MKREYKLGIAILIAAALWFFMFSPWTGKLVDFWTTMLFATWGLATLAQYLNKADGSILVLPEKLKDNILQLLLGIGLAFILWGVFWVGDKLSQMMFDFARPQVNLVYGMKNGHSARAIALMLLLVIGPCEELFWRGYVQRNFIKIFKKESGLFCKENMAFLVTACIYALVHIWSFNFMLVMASLVAGLFWGLLYRIRPSWLPAIVVSHAVWDALVFIVLPI